MKKSFEKHKILISLCVTTFYYPRNNKIQIYDVIFEDLSCFKLFACKDANYELSLRLDLGNKQISSGVCYPDGLLGTPWWSFACSADPNQSEWWISSSGTRQSWRQTSSLFLKLKNAMKTFKNRKISREKVERRKIFAFVLMFCVIKFLWLRLDRNLVASYTRSAFRRSWKQWIINV